ncbi:hypothetical protein EDC96DRAFT_49724 [Choanephora cucurbitarum]|nr:hypothetical protein EDC96DRAFT_49724 [Choanephora cucurbitarum]
MSIDLSRPRKIAFITACVVTFTTSLSFKLGQLTSIFADLGYHLFCITYCYSAQHVMSGYLLSLATMVTVLSEMYVISQIRQPRIKLSTLEGELPFILTRKQFPVRLCFAMAINKAQGQSLQNVGIDLRYEAFAHGQLYVAFSRATSWKNITVLFSEDNEEETTRNIVYPELLLN